MTEDTPCIYSVIPCLCIYIYDGWGNWGYIEKVSLKNNIDSSIVEEAHPPNGFVVINQIRPTWCHEMSAIVDHHSQHFESPVADSRSLTLKRRGEQRLILTVTSAHRSTNIAVPGSFSAAERARRLARETLASRSSVGRGSNFCICAYNYIDSNR